MLVGDVVHQVNSLSSGGITSGMIGWSIAGRIADEAIKMNKLDHIFSYDKAWYDRIGKKHEVYNRIKNRICDFTDDKFNNIANAFNKVPYEKWTFGNCSQQHW